MLSKDVCKECTNTEPVTYFSDRFTRVPCPWRVGVSVPHNDDESWAQGRVTCPNGGTHHTDQIPPDCLRKKKQRVFFEMAMWIINEASE